MPTKPLDRLVFAQGGLCFFCRDPLPKGEASVEHLVGKSNGGGNGDDNCVACCKALNALFGSMSLKEKIQIVLNQGGRFRCPNKIGARKAEAAVAIAGTPGSRASVSLPEKLGKIIEDLRRRSSARPRTVKTLSSTIGALFQKKLSEQEISSLIERLQSEGVIVVSGAKVSYELPNKVA